ncbi:hypothetical protein CsSME_00021169 [Camellia sinensis var. sinensis]
MINQQSRTQVTPGVCAKQGNEVKESIVFNGDSLCLLLDEHLLQWELTPHKYKDAVADDGSAITGTTHHDEVVVFTDSNAFIHWLFSGSSIGEDLESLQVFVRNRAKPYQRLSDQFQISPQPF